MSSGLSIPKNIPIIPPLPEPSDRGSNPVVAVCGKCGLPIKQTMGYVCDKDRCPILPQARC